MLYGPLTVSATPLGLSASPLAPSPLALSASSFTLSANPLTLSASSSTLADMGTGRHRKKRDVQISSDKSYILRTVYFIHIIENTNGCIIQREMLLIMFRMDDSDKFLPSGLL